MMEILKSFSVSQLKELDGSLTYGLTLFEVLRVPRIAGALEYEGIQASLNGSGLREEISCAICSGIVAKCVVIKTCLHRFCSRCIEKCVRIGIRECPKCRKHVPSRRFLKADPIYDCIISKIVTNVEVFEELSDTFTMALNKGLKNDPSIQAIRWNFLNENPRISIGDLRSSEFSIESKFDFRIYEKEVKRKRSQIRNALPKGKNFRDLYFRIWSDGTLPQIFPDGISCDGTMTIHQLSLYIKTELGLDELDEISVYLKEYNYFPSSDVTLAFVRNKTFTMSHEALNIYYGSFHLTY